MLSKINRQDIFNMANTRDIYLRGHNLFTDGKVSELVTAYDDATDIESIGALVGSYRVRVFVEVSSSRIAGHVCPCNHHVMWRGACDHVIAVLLFAAAGRVSIITGQATTDIVSVFERHMLKEIENEIDSSDAGAVGLYPSLHISDSIPCISLSIGSGRTYIVKNIEELLTNIELHNSFSYGRDLSFRHSLSSFEPSAIRLIHFLRRVISTIGEITSLVTDDTDELHIKKNLPLSKEYIDDFFEIMLGEEIELQIRNRQEVSLLVSNEPFEPKLEVAYENGAPTISGKKMNFRTLAGKRYGYLFYDKVYRVTNEYLETIAPLLRAVSDADGHKLKFLQKDLFGFCNVVLPVLKRAKLVDGVLPEDLSLGLAESLNIKIYLSTEGAKILCKALFCYGETEINPLLRSPGSLSGNRDKLREYRLTKLLENYGFEPDVDREAYILSDDDAIFRFFISGVDSLRGLGEVYTTDDFFKKSYFPAPSKPNFGLRFSGNLIEMNFDMTGYTIPELLEALDAYRSKKRYYRLNDGRYLNLGGEDIKAAEEILGAFEFSKKDYNSTTVRMPKYRAIYLDEILKRQNVRPQDEEFKSLTEDFAEIPKKFPLDKQMNKILRTYQKTGYQWLSMLAAYNFGGILADDMGLGKTVQVIALIQSEVLNNTNSQSLVVSPTSLIYNWEHEFNRFAPEIRVEVLAGLPARRKELLDNKSAHVFITTYDMLKRDIENYKELTFKYLIADEAQYIKNPSTQNAVSIKKIHAEARFALTGTPIENSLSELWSIFDFVMPGYLYSPSKFAKFFETPIMKNDDTEKSSQLRKQIAPFILRRLKKDVLTELPDKVETNLYAEMSEEQRKLYAAYLLKARGELESANQIEILAQLTRLRQICCHPALFADNYNGGSGKLDLTIETILSATESGHRVLLFSQFTSMLEILLKSLDKNKISYYYLDGKTSSRERINMVNEFNGGERQVFAISLKAGGNGLNLTGADVVIHYDPWWNPAVMNQASDRAHRFGQEKVVQVINIVTKNSIEEKILDLQARKKNLADVVITEGGSFLNKMSAQEILELFRE